MSLGSRQCSLDQRPWPQRAATAVTKPVSSYLSRQAARPRGLGGRVIGRLWVAETAAVNDAALRLLAPRPGEDVLEIGFGPGRTLGLLAERGATVIGVDVSEQMRHMARRRNADLVRSGRLALPHSDGVALPVGDASVDAVLSVHNIYFWSDPEHTLAEIARVLRPGGRVLIVFRAGEHPLPKRLDPTVYREVTTQHLLAWLERAEFTDAEAHRPGDVASTLAFVSARRNP